MKNKTTQPLNNHRNKNRLINLNNRFIVRIDKYNFIFRRNNFIDLYRRN
jgi:hypothetical protein